MEKSIKVFFYDSTTDKEVDNIVEQIRTLALGKIIAIDVSGLKRDKNGL